MKPRSGTQLLKKTRKKAEQRYSPFLVTLTIEYATGRERVGANKPVIIVSETLRK